MLTADRQAYTERALLCFAQQTYPESSLFILDTGQRPFDMPSWIGTGLNKRIQLVHMKRGPTDSLGRLRNLAAFMIGDRADILMHWDSDDWSAPGRMEAQVRELLAHPGVDLTGFESMYFYRKPDRTVWRYYNKSYCIGTSLAYWWKAWHESAGFPHLPVGEDHHFQLLLRRTATHAGPLDAPLMIAELHHANTKAGRVIYTGDPRTDVWTPCQNALELVERKLGYAKATFPPVKTASPT